MSSAEGIEMQVPEDLREVSIQRYRLEHDVVHGGNCPDAAGEGVLYADYASEIERLKYVKCSKCTTMIPSAEVVRCVDCKEPLCERHVFTHFDAENKWVRESLKNKTSELAYVEKQLAALTRENRELREALEELIFASRGLVEEKYLRDARAALAKKEAV